jgi:hypothetical protein
MMGNRPEGLIRKVEEGDVGGLEIHNIIIITTRNSVV